MNAELFVWFGVVFWISVIWYVMRRTMKRQRPVNVVRRVQTYIPMAVPEKNFVMSESMVLSMISASQKAVAPIISIIKCEYCGQKNAGEQMKCDSCGAPLPMAV